MRLIFLAIALLAVALATGSEDSSSSDKNARILAAYSTRTIVSLSTTTVTSAYTCLSKVSATGCLGRKMRRYKKLMNEEELDSGDRLRFREEKSLEGSVNTDDLLVDTSVQESDDDMREGRIALTVWSTTTSSYTVTSTSTNKSTTLSLSYWCSAGAWLDYPPTCA